MRKMYLHINHKWIVFVAAVSVAFFDYGLPASLGGLYIAMLDTFNAGRVKTAFVQSLLFTFCQGFGVISGLLISKFGMKIVTYCAAVFTGTGFIVSYFADSIYHLYGSLAVILGIGNATMYVAAVLCVERSFTGKEKFIALAVQSIGTAISGSVWPSLLSKSLQTYSLRGTFLILGGLFLNNIAFAIVFAGTKRNSNTDANNEVTNTNTEEHYPHGKGECITEMSGMLSDTESTHNTDCTVDRCEVGTEQTGEKFVNKDEDYKSNKSDVTYHGKEASKQNKSVIENMHRSLNSLLCLYLTYTLAAILHMSTLHGFLIFYQDINVFNGLSIAQSDATFIVYSLFNILSRLLPVIPAQVKNMHSFTIPILSSLCGATGQVILLCASPSMSTTAIAMAFSGISDGGWVSSMQAIIFDILPKEKQAVGFGFVLTALGVASAATGPLFGLLRDGSTSYQTVLIITTAMFGVSALLECLCLFQSKRLGSKK